MSESLSDAVREAAGRESLKQWPGASDVQARKRKAFIHGAVWAVERLPSDDDLFEVIHDAIPNLGIPHASMDGLYSEIACDVRDAVLALTRKSSAREG